MSETDPQRPEGEQPGTPEPARLRRGLLGYRRSDVDRTLATRDAQLAELRQDIAALWLAFAQHDRILRDRAATDESAPSTPAQAGSAPGDDAEPDIALESPEAIGERLAGLDEVLAAIEAATHTLERGYAGEAAAGAEPAKEPDERTEDGPGR